MELILKAKDIRVEFKGRDVLDIDNLEVYDYDRIGLVGANGAGKSTLTDALIGQLTTQGKKVAVLCVDPSSPFNKGALLFEDLVLFVLC